jgi:DNA-binding response OmpR family regulator
LLGIAQLNEPIDLLITDVVMPKMNGRVLSEQIKALRPLVKVLFTSGYTQNVIAQHGVLEAGIQFLPKPYSVDVLAGRVRELLG